jgi:hypothetical protein
LLKVIVVTVLALFTVSNFFQLGAITFEEDDAIKEHSFIPHQKTNLSSNNTATQDVDARSNDTVNMGKPISPINKTIDHSVKIATKKHTNRLFNAPKQTTSQKKIKLTNVTLKIPTPVLLASLPKSGTTSVWRYFLCGGQTASHHFAKVNETWSNKTLLGTGDRINGAGMVSGQCMKWNAKAGRPFLDGCGDYNVWTDTGFISIPKPRPVCYYPAIEGLEEWIKSYPNSTIILITRNIDSWVRSISRWSGGSLVKRWDRCNLTGFVGRESTELAQFYKWHLELIRDFARNHPSITYIEAQIENPNIASILHAKTGIPSSCWGDCKPTEHTCTEVPSETSASLIRQMLERLPKPKKAP